MSMNADSGATLTGSRSSPIRECFAHTDLEWRLTQIPDWAACRGVFLNTLDDRAGALSAATQRAYREFFQLYRFSPMTFHPVRDYLTRIACLSQIHFGSPNIYEGIYEIHGATYTTWKQTLIGRAVFALLGTNVEAVYRALQRGYAGSHFINYASMQVERLRSDQLVLKFGSEYVYIEYAMKGATMSAARACGVPVKLDVDLHDPFNGDIFVTFV